MALQKHIRGKEDKQDPFVAGLFLFNLFFKKKMKKKNFFILEKINFLKRFYWWLYNFW